MNQDELKKLTPENAYTVRIEVGDLRKLLEERKRLYEQVTELQEKCSLQLLEIRGLTGGCSDDPRLKDVLTRANELPVSELELDEIVHDLKSQEAGGINNGGRDEQFRYLYHVLGEKELFRRLKKE